LLKTSSSLQETNAKTNGTDRIYLNMFFIFLFIIN
jgi:hypothetical protein